MKAIILAGGAGTRLHPATSIVTKQLLPVYDKPMIYYPLATAIAAGATEVLFITAPEFKESFQRLFRSGKQLGVSCTYKAQANPRGGIGEAFIIGADYIGSDRVMLVLGDNIFCGLGDVNLGIDDHKDGAHVLAIRVKNPKDYGVIRFSDDDKIVDIVEKPEDPQSDWIVPGLYVYSNDIVRIARDTKRSERKELEITTINQVYLSASRLTATRLPDHVTWFDCGTPDTLLEASNFVATWERHHRTRLGCPAEASFRRKLIGAEALRTLSRCMQNTMHREYLDGLASSDHAHAEPWS